MTKDYYVEVNFTPHGLAKWALLKSFKKQKDAMAFISNSEDSKYPMRIIRVVRTEVFGEVNRGKK